MSAWQRFVRQGGLQRRLLLRLLLPLVLLGLLNTWFDYRLADSTAIQRDRQLLTLVPQLAQAVRGERTDPELHMALSPELEDFLGARGGAADFVVLNDEGGVLAGAEWLRDYPPDTREPEFSSQEYRGVVYRIVSQRVQTQAGELTVRLADGASMRWQRLRRLWLKVLLPNALLVLLAYAAVNWGVRRAMRPLLELRNAVAGRSPRDLSPLDADSSLEEVRPLVRALNHLFGLVNAQAESQRRFVADAAHQMRTPLAGLQAQVEALAQSAPPAQQEQMLRLRDSTRRTSQLVQQLLTLSRVEAPGMLVQPGQRVALRALCEQMLEDYLDAAARCQIDFGLEAEVVSAEGDEWLLRELLSNLIDNALKYSPPGARVTLRCHACAEVAGQPARVYLAVEDDGPGVPVDERGRILQRFYRIAGSASDGSGLGLSIADEIARAHHSQLQIASARGGRGLCVSLLLRAVRE